MDKVVLIQLQYILEIERGKLQEERFIFVHLEHLFVKEFLGHYVFTPTKNDWFNDYLSVISLLTSASSLLSSSKSA